MKEPLPQQLLNEVREEQAPGQSRVADHTGPCECARLPDGFRQGDTTLKATITGRIQTGAVSTTFHDPESGANGVATFFCRRWPERPDQH